MIKKILSGIVVVIFTACIIVTQYLIRTKPDTANIPNAQKISELTKPSVVRVVEGYNIKWKYNAFNDGTSAGYMIDYLVQQYLAAKNYSSSVWASGSGAIISSNGYIVTNAHVVEYNKKDNNDLIDENIKIVSNDLTKIFNSYFSVSYDDVLQFAKEKIKTEKVDKFLKVVLPGGVVCDGEIKSYGAPVGEGKDVSVIKIEKKNLPTMTLSDSDTVALQENVWVLGYPGAGDSSVLSDESILVVSITDGKISAVDKKSTQGAPVIQISAAASYGNSGGPVIREDGTIIGLLTFKSENSGNIQGFTFVVPSNTMKEFIAQSGATMGQSEVDRLYKEGLNLMWGGYYKDALKNFEGVQRLYPEHSEIKKLIGDCQEKINGSKILWSNYKNIFNIVDIVLALLIVTIVTLLILDIISKKKKALAASCQSANDSVNAVNNINSVDNTNYISDVKTVDTVEKAVNVDDTVKKDDIFPKE